MQNRWTWLMAALLVAGCEQDGNVGTNVDLGPADSGPALEGHANLDGATTDATSAAGWVVTLGGTGYDNGVYRVADDGKGNLVALATVTGEVTLEGKDGAIKLTGPASRTVIAKLDKATQKWVWAVELGGDPQDNMSGWDGLAVDASGNIYYAGKFTGTTTFGSTTLTSAGDLDIFVVKLDADGEVKWAVPAGGPGEDDADTLAVADGKLVVGGLFSATADFGGHSLVAKGKNDLFVARLDADSGAFDWAVGAGSDTTDVVYEFVQSVVIDDAGNSYVGGGVGGGATFGGSVIAGDVGKLTAYVAKLDPAGKFVWAKRIWATDTRGLALDDSGDVYLVAAYKNEDLPDPGSAAYSNTLLVARGDSAGNFWDVPEHWLRYLMCAGVLDPAQIVVDGKGNSTVAGWFMGEFDIGPTHLSAVDKPRKGFVAWLDSSGNYTNAVQIKGGMSMVWHLARDAAGGLYAAGAFAGTGDFDGNTATASAGTEAGFIWYIPGLQ